MTTPITALYAGLLGLLVVVLAARVVAARQSEAVDLGDGGNETVLRRIRIHGNAVENIPIALLLMLILEINGSSATLLHVLGGALVIGRLAHVQGLTSSRGRTAGRIVGNTLTWLVIVAGAIVAMMSCCG